MTTSSSSSLFDIKAALVGPISSGKTTVLNALLGDDYGTTKSTTTQEERTSNEIVFCRVNPTMGPSGNLSFDASATASYYPRSNISSVVAPEVRMAERERITNLLQQEQAQAILQRANSNKPNNNPTFNGIPQRHVQINLPQNLFEMRQDTQLVLVDIPGIDSENLEQCPYANYLHNQWDSFDCILIVLDVTAKPKDQETILHFIKHNLEQQIRLPVLCLWNKLDDPYDPKGLELIQQTQSLISLVLQPPQSSPAKAKQKTQQEGSTVPFSLPEFMGSPNVFGPPMTNTEILNLQNHTNPKETSSAYSQPTHQIPSMNHPSNQNSTALAIPLTPIQPPLLFLPLSAKEALVYKRVSNMNLNEFAIFFEQDWMVQRLSRDQIGLRKWNRMSYNDQLEESFLLLQDPNERNRALQECGYTNFHDALADLIGNRQGAQTLILETRMELSLRALLGGGNDATPQGTLLAPQLYSVVTKFQVLYGSTEAASHLPQELQTAFWAAYDKMENNALKQVVEHGPTHVGALADPLEQLLSYQSVCDQLQWKTKTGIQVNTAKRMRQIVIQYLQLLFEQEFKYHYEGWGDNFQARCKRQTDKGHAQRDPWTELSPKDWIHVWSSILLLSYDQHFCQHYVREKLLMEELLDKAKASWKTYQNMPLRICPHCAESLQPYKNEFRCQPCRFAFHTCFPTTMCNGCKGYRFDEYDDELHHCDNGYTYSTQQALHNWMKTFYDRSQHLVPTYPNLYKKVAVLGDIPESLADPNHMGHVLFQACHFLNNMAQQQEQQGTTN